MDLQSYKIRPTKHFALSRMRAWGYDVESLKEALESANTIEKVGKNKYEAYIRAKEKSRKIIFVKDEESKEIIIITGAEGK